MKPPFSFAAAQRNDAVLFAFYMLAGILFVGLVIFVGQVVPPWQGPDESTHLEAALLVAQHQESSWPPPRSPDVQREILTSMEDHRFWEYVGLSRPWPVPTKFADHHFFRNAETKLNTPPLYYWLVGALLRGSQSRSPADGLALARFVSALLTAATLMVSAVFARLLYSQSRWIPVCVVLLMLAVPQFVFQAVTVNSDHLVNLFMALAMLGIVGLSRHRDCRRFGWLGVVLVAFALGWFTKRSIVLVLPFVVLAAVLLPNWQGTWGERYRKPLLAGAGIVALTSVVWLLFGPLPPQFMGMREAVLRFAGVIDAGPPATVRVNYIAEYFFNGFWLRFGHVRFTAPGWSYALAHLPALIGLGGCLAAAWKEREARVLLGSLASVVLVIIIRSYGPDLAIQGRYIFGMMPVFAVAVARGWSVFAKRSLGKVAGAAAIVSLLAFNIVAYGEVAAVYGDHAPRKLVGLTPQSDGSFFIDIGEPETRPLLRGDFYEDQRWDDGTTTAWMGRSAAMDVPAEVTNPGSLEVTVRFHPFDAATPNRLRLKLVDQQTSWQAVPNPGWYEQTFIVQKGEKCESELVLVFDAAMTARPLADGRTLDPRSLSLNIDWVRLKMTPAPR